jgi:cellulose synthase/poly-beta-1,6-N-acetylglucosamine synthase-like glycosyltransferase
MTDDVRPELSLVVSSVGRPDTFRRLLESLSAAPRREAVEVVLVDQSVEGSCLAVAAESWPMQIVTATSRRGAAIGRNVGLRLATAAVVGFPDDDAYYPPQTIGDVLDRMAAAPELLGVCGQQQTRDGRMSMLRWRSGPTDVTRWNFLHTSIMSTMFFRRAALDTVGGFDESMGVGAPGWYHAGEESDLVLRVATIGPVRYEPSVVVWQDEPRDVPDEAFVRKMLEYGCGQGHLWRVRRLPRSLLAWYLARKIVGWGVRTVRGDRVLARADIAWLRGNIAGYRDRCPAELRDLPTMPVETGDARPAPRSAA